MNYKALAAIIVAMAVISAAAIIYFSDKQKTEMNVYGAENNQYTVSFDSNGGSETKAQKSIYNYYISLPSDVTRTGYILTEWNTDSEGKGVGYQPGSLYLVQGNTTLYAVWTAADKYYDSSMNYEVYAGTEYEFSPYIDDEQTNYIRENFSSSEEGRYNWHMFYHYDWSIRAFTYELTGTASWLKCDLIKTTGSGKTYVTGISFSGTPTAPGTYFVEFIGKESSDVVIHYKWCITVIDASCGRYQVSFDHNGGAGVPIPSRSAQYNNLVTLPSYDHSLPSRTGYVLTGWQDPNGAVWPLGSMYAVSSNTIMKAHWTADPNVIVFDVSGSFASSGSSAYAVYTGSSIRMPDYSSITKTGYILAGWYDSTDKERIYNKNYEISSVSGDRIFAAYFVPENASLFNVTYDANGGICATGNQSQQVEGEKYAVLPSIGYNKENSTLVSWNTKADGTGESYSLGSSVKVTSDVTLYAQWYEETEETYYNIYFALNGGIGNIQKQSVLSGDTAAKPSTNPTKAGSIFAGWSLSGKESDLYDFSKPVTGSITLTAVWVNHFTLRISDQTLILTFASEDVRKHVIKWGDSSSEEINDGRQSVTSHKIKGGTSSYVTVETTFLDNTTVSSSRSYYIPLVIEEQVTIVFKGEGMQEYTISKGSVISLPSKGFNKEGYILAAWELSSTEETYAPGDQYTAEEDVTFNAVYKEKSDDLFILPILCVTAVSLAVYVKTRSKYAFAVMSVGAAAVIVGGML